jgi:hypothetical protein
MTGEHDPELGVFVDRGDCVAMDIDPRSVGEVVGLGAPDARRLFFVSRGTDRVHEPLEELNPFVLHSAS